MKVIPEINPNSWQCFCTNFSLLAGKAKCRFRGFFWLWGKNERGEMHSSVPPVVASLPAGTCIWDGAAPVLLHGFVWRTL